MPAKDNREDVPEGWALTRFQDVCEINPPKAPNGSLPADAPVTFVPMPAVDAEEGAITAPQARRFSEVRKGFTSFRENDVIMAKITPCMENGKATIARNLTNGLGFGSTEFHVLRSTGAVLPQFLYYFIRQESYRKIAEAEMTGSVGQKRVPQWFLERTELPLPPLSEQTRIVANVTDLMNAIKGARDHVARVPAILKRFRQAVLAAACSGGLTEDWRAAIGTFELPTHVLGSVYKARLKQYEQACLHAARSGQRKPRKPENLQPQLREPQGAQMEIPDSWMWLSLRDVAASHQYAMTSGPFGSALGTKDYRSSGIPVIRGQNIQAGHFVSNNLVFVANDKANELIRSTAYPDDIVVVAVGTSGQAAVVPRAIKRAVLSQNCNKITIDKSIALPIYVASFLQISAAREQLKERTTDTARPFLSLTNLKETIIPVPPLFEQNEIVRRIDALFRLADTVERHVAEATVRNRKLTQSILAKAFRGELVPTEAELARREGREYEPASVLLERIKVERGGTPRTSTKRPRSRGASAD